MVVKKKKQKTRKSVIKKLKFENCKNCLDAIQLQIEINCIEINYKNSIDSLKKNHKEFMKKSK